MKKFLLIGLFIFFLASFPVFAEEAAVIFGENEKEFEFIDNLEIPDGLRAMMTEPKDSEPMIETIADVNIRNAEINEIEKNHLKLVFDVENSMELQADMIYGLELIKEQEEGKVFLGDVKVFWNDKLTVEKNGKVHREIEYRAPEYLNGDFVLWLKIKDESGLILATQPFNVNLAGVEKFIQQTNPCYLTIEGEDEKKYNLRQGVDLKKEEKLFLNCQAENLTEEAVSIIPGFEFYRRDIFGPQVGKAMEGEELSFASRENKLTKIAIPLPESPQAYDVKITLKRDGQGFSNPVIAHFVLTGKSASISNLTIDKNQYRKGESAKLSFFWSGPADTFLDSRTGGSGLVDPIFEFEIKTQDGKELCASRMTKKANEFDKSVEILLEKDCVFPAVTVRIIDENVLLYEKTINTKSTENLVVAETVNEVSAPNSANKKKINLVVLFLISLALILLFWLIRKRKKDSGFLGMFVLLVLSCFFLSNNSASAATQTLYGTPFLQTWASSALTGTNWVDIRTCGVSLSGVPVCPRTPACYYPNYKAVKYNGTIYGCYRDVVTFNYNLSSTSVNQGSSITASGSATGVNVCNNGVTVNMAVAPRYGVSSSTQYILSNVWFNDSNVAHSGSTSFSTSGWSCGNYQAAFAYTFYHTQTYSGSGSIYYSVNNCCTQTCSTGPGCRSSSLSNGSVAGGVCCGGTSCYNCNSGYYWTGSYCAAYTCGGSIVANAAAYDAEESSAPVPASTNWIYSASDTGTKCQFRCNAGYSWNGSACVLPPTNGTCGTANGRIFASTVTTWSPYTTCSSGTASPTFPAIGTTRTWTCLGQNGGSNSPTCSASRVAAPTLNFSAAPNPVNQNTASTLSWTTTGASSCWASNSWTGWKTNTGGTESTGPLTVAKTYTLECWNSANTPASQTTGARSVTVGVNAPTNNAQCVSVSGVPLSINIGGTFSAQVRVRNIGTKIWNSDASPHRLGSANPRDNATWGLGRVNLPVPSVSQNGEVTFIFNATAPTISGIYPFSWQMVEDSIEWFGPVCSSANVTVIPAAVNGACGTANGVVFPSTATGWSPYTTCSSGTASPAFPAIGATTTWTCLGQNGGSNSPTCSASRCEPLCTPYQIDCTGCGWQPKYDCVSTCGSGNCIGVVQCSDTQNCGSCNSGNWVESGEESFN